jgi:uncharacterized DUF497 family protein
MNFEWDAAKNRANIAKHGFDFLDARQIFDGRPRLDIASPRREEARLLTIAILDGQFIALIWTPRSNDVARFISMRRARRAEERQYRQVFG